MPDFQQSAPPVKVTNPDGVSNTPYPKYVYRGVAAVKNDKDHLVAPDGAVVVAWSGPTPICNECMSVGSEDAEAAAVKDGYALAPVVPKPVDAAKGKSK